MQRQGFILLMLVTLVALSSTTTEGQILPGGLVSWWNGQGTANDLIGGNHGTLQAGAIIAAGKYGQGFEFDGSGGYVDVSMNSSLKLGSITVSGWAKSSQDTWNEFGWIASARDNIFAIDHGFLIHPIRGTKDVSVHVGIAGSYNSVTYTLSDITQWHHYALTYDTSELKMYVDGILVGSDNSYTGNITYDTVSSFYIGADLEAGGSRVANGSIDEVMIFDRALSGEEINQAMNVIPEPSSFVLLGVALAGLAYRRRERRKGARTSQL